MIYSTTAMRGHQLLTKEIRAQMPPLYSTEDQGLEALARVKFFTPRSNWTWYGSEFDGDDTFFGLVVGFETELGYFSLSELETARDKWGAHVERDMYFKPTTLRELLKQHERSSAA